MAVNGYWFDTSTLLAFITTTLVLIISPGPDTLLILRYTLISGRKAGMAAVAGVQAGLAGHTIAAAVGLSVIVASLPEVLRFIAALGALYLAWLGLQNLFANTARLRGNGLTAVGTKASLNAMVTNLLNPKVILLYLALMPNFIDLTRGHVPGQLVTLGLILIFLNTAWQVGLVLTVGGVGKLLDRPRVQRAIAQGTGLVLIVFSLLMLFEHVI